jgi:hypothetical protein
VKRALCLLIGHKPDRDQEAPRLPWRVTTCRRCGKSIALVWDHW